MGLYSIVYVSTATVPFWDEEVAELLEKSRSKNDGLGLTGMLLFKGGQFMQVLEGPESAVRSLIATISKDPRHEDVRTLWEEPIEQRQFPAWTMGYRGLTDQAIQAIPGYSDFFDATPGASSVWATESRSRWLLDWFRTNRA
ncbi:BLUF domain-containing protein [Naasia lichenicola]|uniref:BLUF domain-containing protein n=1 Tax=Naasia lichenicola TaxID=2565933 RepID=A0A4S4FLD9_9MICO|nr:BLUF domain-containing protein [Naasia lichenicola]THG30026.1 BLUF domain-containing protein [Naasia lichenicola]